MTAAPATASDKTAFSRWGWAGAIVLIALWTVAHIGCHGDEDTELSVAPRSGAHAAKSTGSVGSARATTCCCD